MDFSSLTAEEAIQLKKEFVKKAFEKKESELSVKGKLLTAQRQDILSLSCSDLLHKLKSGQLKCQDTLKAFQAKALIEHKKTNCLTEFVPQAEKWAIERDNTPLDKRGILHGLPVSVKENFDIAGMDTTLGLTKNLGRPSTTDAVLVACLINQGAVPFVKTNVPQIIYSVGCSNPIFGETKNPLALNRSPGGSSGGEAALIKGGGSVLGVGTDMCGSVRIPACFCGTFGIKPTKKRISKEGSYGTYKNMIGVANASGFLANDADGLALAMEAVLHGGYMSNLDPEIPNLPWRKDLYDSKRTLTIGWFEQDDFFPVTHGCKRAIKVATEALKKRGHKLVPFNPPDMSGLYDLAMDIMMSEGGGIMLKHWEGEVIDESVKLNKKLISAPSIVKTMMENYLWLTSARLSKLASQNATKSAELWKAVQLQKEYNDKFFSAWKAKNLDVLIGPAFPCPTPHPSQHGNLMPACIYFGMYNFCDLPCGTLPVTEESEDDQRKLEDYPSDDFVFQCIKKTSQGALGMPLSVQLAALPWQEETVLYAMKELQLQIQATNQKR